MKKTRLSQRTARHPINYDWEAWEERWALMFDASRHRLPAPEGDERLDFHVQRFGGSVPIDVKETNLPPLDPMTLLTPLEFEFFNLFFIRRLTLDEITRPEPTGLGISWWKAYDLYESVKRKLREVVEDG